MVALYAEKSDTKNGIILESVLSEEQLTTVLQYVVNDVLSYCGVDVYQIILFGSYAKHTAKGKSDIDILVLFFLGGGCRTPTITDHAYAAGLNTKYLNLINKDVHLVFEKYCFYTRQAEKWYKDVPSYCKIIYTVN